MAILFNLSSTEHPESRLSLSDGQASRQQMQHHKIGYDLRLAEASDWKDVLRMSRDFHSESPYREVPFSERRVREIFDQYLSSDKTEIMVLLLLYGEEVCGTIVSICSKFPFSEERAASELIWWVDHEHRSRRGSLSLFRAYEYWCRKIGARYSSAVSTEGTVQLDKFYERSGYKKAETTYVKQIKEI